MDEQAQLVQRFGVADYAVFGIMLAISAAIGIYYACSGGKQKTTSEFLMANRSMKMLPVALSVLASFMSAITLLGTPAEVYFFGTLYWLIGLSYFLVIPAAAYLYLPVFSDLNVTSVYEYLDKRFNNVTRKLGSLTFMIQMIMYMSIVLYAPALALSQVTGLSVWGAVLSTGIVCTFYTTIGGIKAVVWTDVFQITMMYAALLTVIIKSCFDIGGFDTVWQQGVKGQRIEIFNFDPNPLVRHSFWSLTFGGYFTWLAIYGVNQAMVQRYMTLPTKKKAQGAIWINLPGLFSLLMITAFGGLVCYAFYHDCDPLTTKKIGAPDQLFPLLVVEVLGELPGLAGLFVSGIFSGALSTVSSGVNSLAAVLLEDFIRPKITHLSEQRATLITKIIALCFGVLCIVLVAVAQQLGNVLQAALSIFGMIGGPLLGLFSLGMFFPWANSIGAIVGMICGLILEFYIGIGTFINKPYIPRPPVHVNGCPELYMSIKYGHNETALQSIINGTGYPSPIELEVPEAEDLDSIYRISYMWYSAIGTCVVCFIGILVSLITGRQNPEDLDPKLITPIMRAFYKKIGVKLGANIIEEKSSDSIGQDEMNGYYKSKEAQNGIKSSTML